MSRPMGCNASNTPRSFGAGRIALVALVALVSLVAPHSAAARWPLPAGGESASGDPEVLFTFDDGPHETYTATVLDTLASHEVQAIFFWVGRRLTQGDKIEERRALVRRAVAEGHLVANHTISHPNMCQIEADEAEEEIDRNMEIYAEASGLPMLLFRTPYGAHCKRLVRMLEERSLDHMHWDIDPQEWTDHDAERAAKYVIKRLKSLEGRAIVILHDTHKVTAKALPKVLEWLDEENARRVEKGERPIRVLSGSDLIVERMESGVVAWAAEHAEGAAHRLHATVSRLIP